MTDTQGTETAIPAKRRFRAIFLVPLLAVVALMCWALASPVGASPDDDFHLASIWCAGGDRDGLCETTGDPATRKVPAEVFTAADCYRHQPEQSAACTSDLDGHSTSDLIETDRGSFQNNYPPVYYATMNLFASPNIQASVIAMRAVNIALFVGITSVLYLLLPAIRRPALLWAWIVTSVPLGLFLIASNNPSAWAIIGGGSVWLALLGYFETSGRRKIALGGLVVLLTVMSAGSRGDAAVYAVLAMAAVVFLSARRERSFWLSALLPAAMAVVAAVFYFSSLQSTVSVSGLSDGSVDSEEQSAASILLSNLVNVQSLWQGVFGSWSLGWFDTPLPALVAFSAMAVAAGVVFAGLRSQSIRKTIVLIGAALVLWLLPTYVLQQSGDLVGANVQPRYLLPLIVLFAGLALLQVDRHRLTFSGVQLGFVVVSLAIAQSVALHFTLRRFITGVGGGGWNLNADIEWWWPVAPAPMVVWLVGSAAFAAVLVILVRELQGISAHAVLEPRSSGRAAALR
ncbi:hypothetical protein ASE14_05475 [Agromyces sp. Root81]|uniref:DUF2142 domain-containing protein n=1 Tax=Agromyces sp. Root81 TaxID=1736601 RepID=UPI0006F5A439|nr:DUF2142 domain-containing protein [Agromyces sp. Root81]KRC60471.1 hypothetical protein ASE14_05475 [Agromyces sp. Root81]